MSLLKLTPESERLRRIAKAHAAGEISRGEFRNIRSGVIDGFGEASLRDVGDATQPRWFASESTTQRFQPVAERAVAAEPDRSAFTMIGFAVLLILVAVVLAGAM
jgi:hypothetical protein